MPLLLEVPQIPSDQDWSVNARHKIHNFIIHRIPDISSEGRKLFFYQGGLTRRRSTGLGGCWGAWWHGRICWRVAWLGSGSGDRRTAIGGLLHHLTSASLQAGIRETSKGWVDLLEAARGKLANHLQLFALKLFNQARLKFTWPVETAPAHMR